MPNMTLRGPVESNATRQKKYILKPPGKADLLDDNEGEGWPVMSPTKPSAKHQGCILWGLEGGDYSDGTFQNSTVLMQYEPGLYIIISGTVHYFKKQMKL